MEDIKRRFDNLESKIDKVNEALIILARIDEKIAAQQESLGKVYQRMVEQDQKIHTINGALNVVAECGRVNTSSIDTIKRVVWLLVTVACTAVAAVVIK